jgi:hypothetical protein
MGRKKKKKRNQRQYSGDLQMGDLKTLFKEAQGIGKYFSASEKTKRLRAKMEAQRKEKEFRKLKEQYNLEKRRLQAEDKKKWEQRYKGILKTKKSLGHKTRRGIGKFREKLGYPEKLY